MCFSIIKRCVEKNSELSKAESNRERIKRSQERILQKMDQLEGKKPEFKNNELLTQYKVLKAARKIIAAFCGKKFGKVIKL
jgi:hypothetical protein